ncbi:MAG TPA: transglycosylase domain-containing protein, partial [Terrimicrobiaceae bacterium]
MALDRPPAATTVFSDMRGTTIAVLPTPDARESYPVKLRDMGEWLPVATVGIEDARFWEHNGVDFRAVAGAALRNLRNGRVISGASTITQQVIKISSPRDGRRGKVQGALAALKLERNWDKRRILEVYLNRLDYGNRRVGPEAAARAYFGKSVRDLSLSEAIFLAGLPQSPTRLNPWKNPDEAIARYRRNVKRLAAIKLLPPEAAMNSLLKNPPRMGKHGPPNEAPQFVELARKRFLGQAKRVGGTAPAQIVTSLKIDLQRLAMRLLREHLSAASPLGVNDAAIVIIENSTGAVRALACSGDPRRASLNSAI